MGRYHVVDTGVEERELNWLRIDNDFVVTAMRQHGIYSTDE